eukprot:m.21942 g.21942  ORF g.21942 m.21942 type:complete len:55 (+) comp9207_c0_seq1:1473-1637(+)
MWSSPPSWFSGSVVQWWAKQQCRRVCCYQWRYPMMFAGKTCGRAENNINEHRRV